MREFQGSRGPEKEFHKCGISKLTVVDRWVGRIALVKWAAEQSHLNLARHLGAIRVAMVDWPLPRDKPDGIEIVTEGIAISQPARGPLFEHAGDEESEVVVEHGAGACQGKDQGKHGEDGG